MDTNCGHLQHVKHIPWPPGFEAHALKMGGWGPGDSIRDLFLSPNVGGSPVQPLSSGHGNSPYQKGHERIGMGEMFHFKVKY